MRATLIVVLLGVLIGGAAAAPTRPSLPVIDFCQATPADVTTTFPNIAAGFTWDDTTDSYASKTNGCRAFVVDFTLGPAAAVNTNWVSIDAGVSASDNLDYLLKTNPSVCSSSLMGVRIYRAYGASGTDLRSLAYATFAFSWDSVQAKCSMNFVLGTRSLKWPWQGWFRAGCKVPAAATSALDTIRVAVWWKQADLYPPVEVEATRYRSISDPGPTPTCLSLFLPIKRLTPGIYLGSVSQTTIRKTICNSSWTRTIRPPVGFTNALKLKQMPLYGEEGSPAQYEEDHLIPLELGGAPRNPKNLWPEPLGQAKKSNSLETKLRRQVCEGAMKLGSARVAIRRFKFSHG